MTKLRIIEIGNIRPEPEGHVTVWAIEKVRGPLEIVMSEQGARWLLAGLVDRARLGYLGEDLRERYGNLT
jgi:hypothetical protein